MRVGIVCPYAWDRFGGVQSHIASLSDTLVARGHVVRVFAPSSLRRQAAAAGPDVRLIGRAVGIPANGSVAPLTFGPYAAVGVRFGIADFAPDVLHLHEPLIPSLSLLALLNSKVPAVGTFHAAADSSAGYRAAAPLLQHAIRKLRVRTAVSDAARDLIARYFPGDYLLTPNGVDVERFATAAPIEPAGRPSVLFFGRIEKRKGLDVLIQAMARLSDLDCELVVAGSGPKESSARSLAASLGVPVRFLGKVPEQDKPGIFRGATVYCAPGLGGESFGIVLVEALASGVPVVCSDLSGYRAVAGGAAELVPAGDVAALADGLRAVLTSESRRGEMGRSSARMANLYDWKRLAAGVEKIYDTALVV